MLDGIDLAPAIDGTMTARPAPLRFWAFDSRSCGEPYIDPELQKGTTPLVKLSGNKATRDFINLRHPEIRDTDYRGARSIIEGDHRLVIKERKNGGDSLELFDLAADPAEATNLAGEKPELVAKLQADLRRWQDSVLKSLTSADYAEGNQAREQAVE